ncbi:hypothetical protein BDP27DRAFT_1370829 [Rhodocollybia butyracea]|uniref:Uncharacterized protein n=1 Tax=Rhodocollybia butyracea TaxID=206335 RepID=A0A9P5U039_9AGAR|nr:hypothetical protein BDP27DRAFT_1370829 [Rhodocollybia butyracea]
MTTITRTREEMERLATQSISYPVHMITPDSNVIRRVTNQPSQATTTENTPLYFPERGWPLGRNPRNRSMSLSPTRLRAARLTTFGNIEAPTEPERSFQHQYYTRESAGMPIRPEPYQVDLQTELENQIDAPASRLTVSPPSMGQQLLAELVERTQELPHTPTAYMTAPSQPPDTSNVFREANHPSESLGEDRISEVVVYPQETGSQMPIVTPSQGREGSEHFRERFIFLDTPIDHSTPRDTDINLSRPRNYAEQYRAIMGENPDSYNDNLRVHSSQEPLNFTQSEFPELRDREEYRRTREQLHEMARLVRDLLVRLGIQDQGERTAVGWLWLLETLATNPLYELPLNLANNIRDPRNARLLNHYVRTIRGQPYRNIVENNDWLSSIVESPHQSPPEVISTKRRILQLRANMEMLSPMTTRSPSSSHTAYSSDEERRRRLEAEAMRLGLGTLGNRARVLLERLGFTPNSRRTPIGWLRMLRDLANVNKDSFTPELSQVFQGDNIDIILGLELETRRREFAQIIEDSSFPSEITLAVSNQSSSQGRSNSRLRESDIGYQGSIEDAFPTPLGEESSLLSPAQDHGITPLNQNQHRRARRDTPWAPRQQIIQEEPMNVANITSSSEVEFPPRPSLIPRRMRYGSTSTTGEAWEEIPPERQYSDEADPVPPYLEQDWKQYQQQLALARSFQQQGPKRLSTSNGETNIEQPEEDQSITELTAEFLQWRKDTKRASINEQETNTSTIQTMIQEKSVNHSKKRGMEWKRMKENEPNPRGIVTPPTTPERDPEISERTNSGPVTGDFVKDLPPHQAIQESVSTYMNPYKRDTRPGVGTSTAGPSGYEYPYIPNKGKRKESIDTESSQQQKQRDNKDPFITTSGDYGSISTKLEGNGYKPWSDHPSFNSENSYINSKGSDMQKLEHNNSEQDMDVTSGNRSPPSKDKSDHETALSGDWTKRRWWSPPNRPL